MIAQKLKVVNQRLFPGKLFHNPDWIILGVNNLCNLHCKMCDVGTQYEKSNFFANLSGNKPNDMPKELILRIIDQMASYFPNAKLGYAFTEPLIYPHLIESLCYADKLGLYTSITTNALTLAKKADGIAKSGLNDLSISLDGPPEIHNFIRGNSHSFQRAMDGIDLVIGMNQPPGISVFCVVTEWNIGHLVSFIDHFRHFPLKQLGFMHANFTTQHIADHHNNFYGDLYPTTDSNVQEFNIKNMELDLLWQEIKQIKNTNYSFPVKFSPEMRSRDQIDIYYKVPDRFIGKRCNDIFKNIMVKSDGTIIPAHGRCYNFTVGNIYEDNLKAIWNSQAVGNFRRTVSKAGGLLPACSRCCGAFGNS